MFVGCGCNCWDKEQSSTFRVSSGIDSGSLQSFGSSIADPPGQYPGVICAACVDDVAPAAYEVVWNYNGELSNDPDMPRPCCQVYRGQSTFKLFASRTASCSWASLEQQASQYIPFNSQTGQTGNEWLCSTTLWSDTGVSAPRVSMSYFQPVPTENKFYAAVIIHFSRGFWDTFLQQPARAPFWSGHTARYFAVDSNGDPQLFDQGSIFCLVPRIYTLLKSTSPGTLERGPIWTSTNVDGQGVPYGAPCKQVRFSGFDLGLPNTLVATPVPA
jgi:hypothetical protein